MQGTQLDYPATHLSWCQSHRFIQFVIQDFTLRLGNVLEDVLFFPPEGFFGSEIVGARALEETDTNWETSQ